MTDTARQFSDRPAAAEWIGQQKPAPTDQSPYRALLVRLEAERLYYVEAAARTRVDECVISHSSKAHAFQVAAAHAIAVFYGAEEATDYMRDGTLPAVAAPATPDGYEAVLTAELTRLAGTMIDPGTGSDVGDQVAVVMGLRDTRMRQLEAEVARLKAEVGMLGGHPVEPVVRDHIGGNAEDCPGCDGTNPPYPFICPGSGESAA